MTIRNRYKEMSERLGITIDNIPKKKAVEEKEDEEEVEVTLEDETQDGPVPDDGGTEDEDSAPGDEVEVETPDIDDILVPAEASTGDHPAGEDILSVLR